MSNKEDENNNLDEKEPDTVIELVTPADQFAGLQKNAQILMSKFNGSLLPEESARLKILIFELLFNQGLETTNKIIDMICLLPTVKIMTCCLDILGRFPADETKQNIFLSKIRTLKDIDKLGLILRSINSLPIIDLDEATWVFESMCVSTIDLCTMAVGMARQYQKISIASHLFLEVAKLGSLESLQDFSTLLYYSFSKDKEGYEEFLQPILEEIREGRMAIAQMIIKSLIDALSTPTKLDNIQMN